MQKEKFGGCENAFSVQTQEHSGDTPSFEFNLALTRFQSEYDFDVRASNNEADASRIAAKESLVKMQLHGSRLGSSASSVTWSECASEHLYDVATGTANPNPPQVGSFVSLNLDVIFNADAYVVGNYISVLFTAEGSQSPINLYAQDFASGSTGQYVAGDEYTDALNWLLPSFAPLGHYHAQIQVHGANKDKDIFACLVADFDIHA
jgi:hypothetical protein